EVVPVLGAATDGGFELREAVAAEVVFFERGQNVIVGEAAAVQRDAHAGGEDRVYETARITDHDKTVTAELLHRVTVVALVLEGANAARGTQRFRQRGTRSDRVPEKFLAVFL